MKLILTLVILLTLAGCTSTRTGSLCTAGPIIPDMGAVDRWTDSEKRQVVTLNNAGERVCGWKP